MTEKEKKEKMIAAKELEGRYAIRYIRKKDMFFEFTTPQFLFYDALGTAHTSDAEEMLAEVIQEIKTYNDPVHIRYSTGPLNKNYPDYQVDYRKAYQVTEEAHKTGREPLLTAIFWDGAYTWNLNEVEWKNTVDRIDVIKCGVMRKEKEKSVPQVHLPLKGKGVSVIPLPQPPEIFWDMITKLIKADHPDYTPSWLIS